MNFDKDKAAIVRHGKLKPVCDDELQITNLSNLISLNAQKQALLDNTIRFLQNKPANHALLWGEMGCGKSSLVRAVFCEYMHENLRLVEISKFELENLYDILEILREQKNYKFIIFCDDFSFEMGDKAVNELKRLLEGSIQKPPSNVLFYATSNRKHFIKAQKNDENFLIERENSRDNLSLADRFGLIISFYEFEFSEYLSVIDELFGEVKDKEKLHNEARAFADSKGVRSPRSAIHFFNIYKDKFAK